MLTATSAPDGARFDALTRCETTQLVPPFAAHEVDCIVVPCDYAALRREVEQLSQKGLQLTPIIPCELDRRKPNGDLAFTGKNPSRWLASGAPEAVYWQQNPPSAEEVLEAIDIAEKLTKPIGLALLPREQHVVLDFDAHKFEGGAAELDEEYCALLQQHPELAKTRTERTPGGGLHLYMCLKDSAAAFRNFALASCPGRHCGEVLHRHSVAVAWPTVIKTSNRDGAYDLLTPDHTYDFVEIESLEAIGIVPVASARTSKALSAHTGPKSASTDGPPLEHLIGPLAYKTLQGDPSYGDRTDRSYQLTGVAREVYGWRNFCLNNNLPFFDDWGSIDEPGPLMRKAFDAVGIDNDRCKRIVEGVDEAGSSVGDIRNALAHYDHINKLGERPADVDVHMTEEECRLTLSNALRDGAASSDLDTLVAQLGRCSRVPYAALKKISDSVAEEQALVDRAHQDQLRLRAQLEHEGKSAELTLDYFFPQEFADCLRTITEHLPYNDIVATMTILTTVSGVVKLGTSICGNVLTSFVVPANLYTATVGPSGRKKTPLETQLVKDPCRNIKKMVDQHNASSLKHWQQQCIAAAEEKAERPPKPKRLFHQLQDCTDESLMEQLEARESAKFPLLLRRDELSGLLQSQNQYRGGRGSDEQKLLEYFDGNAFMSTRVKGERGYERCHLSIYGGIQNELLKQLVVNGDANGKWARFIFVPLPNTTRRLPTDITHEATTHYENCKDQLALYLQDLCLLQPKTYTLSNKAIERFADYEYSKQQQQQSCALTAGRVLYGKSAGKVLRVTCLLHLVELVLARGARTTFRESGQSVLVTTLEKAIKLVDYLDEWALGFHKDAAASGSRDVASNHMLRLHTIALEHSPEPVSWTDMRSAMSSKEKKGLTRKVAHDLLKCLEELGVGVVSEGPNGGLQYAALRDLPH